MTNREQIIAAAREAGGWEVDNKMAFYPEYLERFYAIAFEAGADSRDAEFAELKDALDYNWGKYKVMVQDKQAEIAELVAALEAIEGGDGAEWMSACASEALAKVRKP